MTLHWRRPIRRTRLIGATLVIVAAACAAPIDRVAERTSPPLPAASYAAALRQGATIYEILPQESLLLVRVGRSGRMARLGHEHAVASEDLTGFVEFGDAPETARADIAFPLRQLVVDKPAYRAHFALDTEPSADDVAGTYSNMLKLLEPSAYPWVTLQARIASTGGDELQLAVSVTLHGTTAEYLLPAHIAVRNGRLVADAAAIIRHSDFGIEPFSAAGGLLRVADELEIDLHVVAHRLQPQRPR